jgi:hypothetical protein
MPRLEVEQLGEQTREPARIELQDLDVTSVQVNAFT